MKYQWGSVAYLEIPSSVDITFTRLYSPVFLEQVFGWVTDLPLHDGIICKVKAPTSFADDHADEPVALLWTNTSEQAIKKRSWSPLDLFGDAFSQIPPGEVGIVYTCHQEGTREFIADRRTRNFMNRVKEWTHSMAIRVPAAFLIRLYPRVLNHGNPDLIENGIRLMSGSYGDELFFRDFPTVVFTKSSNEQ